MYLFSCSLIAINEAWIVIQLSLFIFDKWILGWVKYGRLSFRCSRCFLVGFRKAKREAFWRFSIFLAVDLVLFIKFWGTRNAGLLLVNRFYSVGWIYFVSLKNYILLSSYWLSVSSKCCIIATVNNYLTYPLNNALSIIWNMYYPTKKE